jgi:cytochrome c5
MCFCFFSIFSYATSHHPQDFLASVSGSQNEGEQIYKHFCVTCHAQKPLIALGAPRVHEEKDWAIRLKQDIGMLFMHTTEGLNAMPPRGGCFECSDEQLILALVAMLPIKEQKKALNALEAHKKNIK